MNRVFAALRHVGLLALAGGAANAANVIVTVIIARLLTTREYGGVAQLVGIFVVLSMPGSALLVGVVRRVTALEAAGRHTELSEWVRSARRRTAIGLGLFAIAAIAGRGVLASALGLPGPTGVAEVLIAGGGWTALSVERGLLQSRQAYALLARNLAVEGAVRTAVTVLLVAAGAGIEGTALGLLSAVAGCVVDARRSLGRARRPVAADPAAIEDVGRAPIPAPESVPPPASPPVPHLGADLAVAVAALGLLAVLQYTDVVVVGRLDPGSAGSYAAISVACKALVFGAIVLSGYLLPEAVWRWHHGRHALGPLGMAVGILAVPAVGLIGLAVTAPKTVLRLVFGPKLVSAAPAFGALAVAMAALAASVLLTNYLLGIGRRAVVPVLLVAAGGIAVVIGTGSGTPKTAARVELGGQLLLCAVLTTMVVLVSRRPPGAREASRSSRAHGTTAPKNVRNA
ncbi:MAG: hypothetical protein NVSMB12_02960 [Acidimicrobiales bacterium]